MLLLSLLFSASAALPSGSWAIDRQQSSVTFNVTKFGTIDVEGRFRHVEGEVTYDAVRPEQSWIRCRVRVSSVDTGEADRDQSLQGSAYFDAQHFPELTFVARGVERRADGSIRLNGTITIRGTSRPLSIEARPINGDARRPVFETRFDIDRMDFGVVGGTVMRNAISRTVRVHLRIVGAQR